MYTNTNRATQRSGSHNKSSKKAPLFAFLFALTSVLAASYVALDSNLFIGTFAKKWKPACVQSDVKKPDCGTKKVATWYEGQCKYKCQSAEKDAAYTGGTSSTLSIRRCESGPSAGWKVCDCTKAPGDIWRTQTWTSSNCQNPPCSFYNTDVRSCATTQNIGSGTFSSPNGTTAHTRLSLPTHVPTFSGGTHAIIQCWLTDAQGEVVGSLRGYDVPLGSDPQAYYKSFLSTNNTKLRSGQCP
jgi:hypothetical protein